MSAITPAGLADQAAEAVRNLNHATQSIKGELTYPSDAYEIVGPLNRLADRLPQSFEQLSSFLDNLAKTGALTADHGTADEHIGEARSALASCGLIAQTLAEHLERAHNALSPLSYDTGDEQLCGEGSCQCSCVGVLHACGCDCPRCTYCQQQPEDCDCPDPDHAS